MLTRLGNIADKVMEIGWLVAAVFVPLYFNVYSSRVFEPDKISTLRSFVAIMAVAWVIKLLEGGWRGYREASQEPGTTGRGARVVAVAQGTLQGAAERGLPSWLGFLRVPMVVPVLVYALTYLLSSIFTVTPDATIWGSYQRLQGTYSEYSYMLLGFIVLANMRTRAQLERLVNFMLLTSFPVAAYGLLQWAKLDPLPWAGDTSSRVASSMGNAIFVAAWLIMVVPFVLYRLFSLINTMLVARTATPEAVVDGRGRPARRVRPVETEDYGWAVVANSAGVLFIVSFVFLFALKLMAGLPYPDARLWPALPLAIAIFMLGCYAIEWLGKHRDDPSQRGIYMGAIGFLVFLTALLSMPLSWSISRDANQNLQANMSVDATGLLWVVFFTLLWGSIAAAAYAFAGRDRTMEAGSEQTPGRDVVRAGLVIGYVLLLGVQVLCIYLTQSRGPWGGLGAGLVVFVVATWLVGRARGVRWMLRIGGGLTALIALLVVFVLALNIPNSPLRVLDNAPVIGRGVERLGTMFQTDTGTGLVRKLIWQGATNLIISDPVRTIIGWGPEAMYVAYNPFYPADLAHVELRNATPDRSHNVEFDQLVTTGVVGLVAYYFLLAAFFFYGIRMLKRASSTREQFFVMALLATIASHFVEIQTGIQIASTWTYFYLLVGMLVAFGYYMTGYLRPEVAAASQQAAPQADGEVAEDITALPPVAIPAESRSMTTTAVSHKTAVGAASGGNGRSSTGANLPPASKNRGKASTAVRPSPGQTSGRTGVTAAEARRRQAQQTQQVRTGYDEALWYRNPAYLVLYGILAVVAFYLIWFVNSATVRADTLYKQGQAYDNAAYWPEAIDYYNRAIQEQPNQDYYYLFLGRAWLEWAKLTDTEKDPQSGQPVNQRTGAQYKTAADRQAEKIVRMQQAEQVLFKAHDLNPLNTDHFANLGRLYLYWADPTGGNDPSKAPLAVQYTKMARDRTPGNAQLWDELAVAYSRDNQFGQAIQTLLDSQFKVDSEYARTPFIRGQLYQERALQVRDDLINGNPLPTDGETDFGKLALEAGKAYSETVNMDPTTFVDDAFKSRVDFLVDASKPFTNTNTKLDSKTLSTIVTSTLMAGLELELPSKEKDVADYLRGQGVYNGTDNIVPASELQNLWQNPEWAGIATQGGTISWLNSNMASVTNNIVLVHECLGYVYSKVGRKSDALAQYQRALALDPTNTTIQQDMQSLQSSP